MKQLSKSSAKGLISVLYCLPLVAWLILTIYAAIPHLYFLFEGEAQDTLSLFKLLGNTWEQAMNAFEDDSAPLNQLYFSWFTAAAVLISWLSIALYGVFSILCAICSIRAFSQEPTAQKSNRAKAIFHILCPNRVLFVFFQLLLILPTLPPYIVAACFEKYILLDGMKVCYFLVADWILALVLMALITISFLCLLPAQKRVRRDLFRLYKAQKHTDKS